MLFNSFEFIFLFLPGSFFVYHFLLTRRLHRLAKFFLVLSSLFYYAWWHVSYLPILLVSIVFNFLVGGSLAKPASQPKIPKTLLLTLAILANLSLLAYFKYSYFIISMFRSAADSPIALHHLTLPLAISFFTFQQITYLVDSYQGKSKQYDFINYALFVSFFPQLIAGPIIHHNEIIPQFTAKKNLSLNYKNIAKGLLIFSMGLFKKVVVADSFALWANAGFATAHTLTFVDAWATSLSYTFQIYFDFCGYTDMAIGSALLFNIRLPANFNSPYKALNIQDFWQRWHITLGRFLRDYIYIPLGGNRHGNIKTSINILITFFIAGLWHGAGWTFILWGCLHGLAIVVYRLWKMFGYTMNTVFAWIITFNFINISWVLFRAEDWTKALSIAKAMMRIDKMIISHSFQTVYMNTLYKLSDLFPLISAVDKGHFIFSFDTYFWILLTTYITLTMKNSIELVDGCTANHTSDETKLAFIYGALFFGAIIKMMMCPYTDFLYFDF